MKFPCNYSTESRKIFSLRTSHLQPFQQSTWIQFLFFPISLGSVRIPLQMSKCNHGTNSTYLSMNSFNNNNTLTVPGVTDETTITTSDNLLLQSTTTAANQHWTRNLNGNSQRSNASWRANKATLSLNLSDNSKVINQNTTDDELTPVNANNNGQKILQSPFETARYRKTWI